MGTRSTKASQTRANTRFLTDRHASFRTPSSFLLSPEILGKGQRTQYTTMAPFVDQVHPTMVIKGILSAYPFSLGLFREFLQNSDDAGATKQVCCIVTRSENLTLSFATGLCPRPQKLRTTRRAGRILSCRRVWPIFHCLQQCPYARR